MTSQRALDACPGVLALHPARDGFVARIRLPGGYVTGPRWRALARLANRFGDGCLDLTARGNVQLRGVRADDAAALARGVARAGLLPSNAHDRARNIMASPLAGLAGRPPLRQLVRRLDAALLADPGFTALPGRFLFAVDDGTGGSGLAVADVGLRCADPGFDLIVAGRSTGVGVAEPGAVRAAAAAARAAIAGGVGTSVTRIADLAAGGEAVAAAIGGSLGPPAAGSDVRLPLGAAAPCVTAPGAAAGAAGGAAAAGGAVAPGGPRGDQPDDGETIVAAAPLGRLTAEQMLLAGALLRPGEIVRVGIAGRLVIPLAGPLDAARARLAAAGLLVSGDQALAGVTACSGAACSRSVADVRAVAGPVTGHPRTHWAGCARQCGCPPDAQPVIAADARRFLLPGDAEPRPLALLVAS